MKPSERLLLCRSCGLVQRSGPAGVQHPLRCARCLGPLAPGRPHSIQRTAAFALAALLLYAPANLLPIMEMQRFGLRTENTIWSGCVALYRAGMWAVALIVFCASILVPLVKLIGLFFLVATTGSRRWRRDRVVLHRVLEGIGRWSMLDVFLLSILVALVKLGDIAEVTPRAGIVYFAAVVVLTMLASASFDPQLIWEDPRKDGR